MVFWYNDFMSNIEMPQKEKKWHWLFEAALVVRGINGVIEIIAGFFILGHNVQHLPTNSKVFVALYILAHGILNIFLSIQLYREKVWAYRATLIIMTIFIIYQFIRIYTHHSLILLTLTAIDLLFMVLLWHEYKYKVKISNKVVQS